MKAHVSPSDSVSTGQRDPWALRASTLMGLRTAAVIALSFTAVAAAAAEIKSTPVRPPQKDEVRESRIAVTVLADQPVAAPSAG